MAHGYDYLYFLVESGISYCRKTLSSSNFLSNKYIGIRLCIKGENNNLLSEQVKICNTGGYITTSKEVILCRF